jgi:hypothetical protein
MVGAGQQVPATTPKKEMNQQRPSIYLLPPPPILFGFPCVCVCHSPVLLLAIKREKRGKTGSAANGDEKQRG